MPTNDGSSRFPVFVAPQPSNHQRSPGYVPGRVAPVRSPPPAKAPPPPPLKPHGPPLERQATFSLSEENQRRERAQSLQQRKNTLICFGVSMGAFLLTLILILSLSSGDILDGECLQIWFIHWIMLEKESACHRALAVWPCWWTHTGCYRIPWLVSLLHLGSFLSMCI